MNTEYNIYILSNEVPTTTRSKNNIYYLPTKKMQYYYDEDNNNTVAVFCFHFCLVNFIIQLVARN